MKRTVWIWVIVAAIVLAAGLVVSRGATPRTGKAGGSAAQSGSRRPAPLVVTGHAQRTSLGRTLQLTASITSLAQSVIFPKTSGYLLAVTVRPGDPVRPGQVLALIDHAQLDAQVAQAQASLTAAENAVQTARAQLAAARAQRANAEAGVASAKATVVKNEASLADMQATYNRSAALAKQGAIAQQNLDDAKAQVVSAQATLDASRAQVAAAREQEAASASQVKTQQALANNAAAALDNARVQLQYATITAPFAGVVVSRQLDPGSFVTPGTSTSILTIADLDHLDVVLNVGSPDLPMIRKGDPVKILIDAYPGRVFPGAVNRIAGGVDPMTRTVQVEVDIDNPQHLLRPGMYATVQLSAGVRQALVVPLSAVQSIGTQHYVWLVQEGKAVQQYVDVGQATGEVVEITGGLQPSDTVIIRGADLVRQNQPVRTAAPAPAGTP